MFSQLGVLVRIALANLFSSFLNVFIGIVLAFGAALLVIGGSLFTTLDASLSKSIVGSITGHLQVYAARSKNQLEVYGKVDGSDSSLAPLDDFKALKAKLLALPNVSRVVPMGACSVIVGSGNTVDITLEKLRALYRDRADEKGGSEVSRLTAEEFQRQADNVKAHVRNMVTVLARDAERAKELTNDPAADDLRAVLERASSDAFWASFDADPFGHLELLENKVAPEVGDADLLFVRVLGTDLDAYQQTFDRLAIVEGTQVPTGKRGVLLPKFFVEEFLKLKNARRLDKIKEGRSVGRLIAKDSELQRLVKENQGQTREVVLQLDGIGTAAVTKALQEGLPSKETELPKLLTELFSVDDANFDARYKLFYEQVAPRLTLYRSKVGDDITLRSFGRSGSLETARVKIWGIFEMRGLEKSPLAAANALVDMVTFRELYGFLTSERKAELDAMKASTAAKEVSREDAEAALFGDDSQLEQEAKAGAVDTPTLSRVERKSDSYDPKEIDEGIVLHAAVMLKDGSPLAQLQAHEAIERALGEGRPPVDGKALTDAKGALDSGRLPFTLRAALEPVLAQEQRRAQGATDVRDEPVRKLVESLRASRRNLGDADVKAIERVLAAAQPRTWVVDWATAAGFLGQFITFFRLLLVAIVAAFAFIALIVVTIGVTIATLQRTQTIGTLRAIGAQRTFVVGMVLVETMVLAVVFGLVGALIGAGAVAWMHASGIAAWRDELYFFFSGPTLRPELSPIAVVLALSSTLVVSLLAVLFPLFLATRVSPLVAMSVAE